MFGLILLICVGGGGQCMSVTPPISYATYNQCFLQAHILAGMYSARLPISYDTSYKIQCSEQPLEQEAMTETSLYSFQEKGID